MTAKNRPAAPRPGKRPYLYVHGSMPSSSTSTINTSSPSSKTALLSQDRSDSIPDHWRHVA